MLREHRGEAGSGRSVWAVVLLAALAVVILNFVNDPSSGEPTGVAQHLTFWVPDAQADPDAEVVATQASDFMTLGSQASTVGALPGATANGVSAFLDNAQDGSAASGPRTADDLLVLTTTTLAQLAPDRAGDLLVGRAPLIALLASEPLELAVPSGSPIRTAAQLIAMLRTNPGRRLLGVAEDPWLTDNLAQLVAGAQLKGRIPYTAFASSAAAVAGLESGSASVVLAPSSALLSAVRAHRTRILPWPGAAPTAWVALTGRIGIPRRELAQLRRQAAKLGGDANWQRELSRDGLTAVDIPVRRLTSFLREGALSARRLQSLAARMIQS